MDKIKKQYVTVNLTMSDREYLYLTDNLKYESTAKKSSIIKQYAISLLNDDIKNVRIALRNKKEYQFIENSGVLKKMIDEFDKDYRPNMIYIKLNSKQYYDLIELAGIIGMGLKTFLREVIRIKWEERFLV